MYPHYPRKRRLRIWKKIWDQSLLPPVQFIIESRWGLRRSRLHNAPAVLKVLDPNQYRAIPHSSTTRALIHMVHSWAQATDGNSATIRTVLLDYRKAFDLIDHGILVDKLCKLVLPTRMINWIIDFLSGRSQRIKLAECLFRYYQRWWKNVKSVLSFSVMY